MSTKKQKAPKIDPKTNLKCTECGDVLPSTSFYDPTHSEATCKNCVDGFWEMMGDDPCGKNWEP